MCVQFFASAIYVTTGVAGCTDHEGQRYVNEDFPSGSLYCEDADGNLYRYIGSRPTDIALHADSWPERERDGIPLYRDYWRHIASSKDAPYTRALLCADREQVR